MTHCGGKIERVMKLYNISFKFQQAQLVMSSLNHLALCFMHSTLQYNKLILKIILKQPYLPNPWNDRRKFTMLSWQLPAVKMHLISISDAPTPAPLTMFTPNYSVTESIAWDPHWRSSSTNTPHFNKTMSTTLFSPLSTISSMHSTVMDLALQTSIKKISIPIGHFWIVCINISMLHQQTHLIANYLHLGITHLMFKITTLVLHPVAGTHLKSLKTKLCRLAINTFLFPPGSLPQLLHPHFWTHY